MISLYPKGFKTVAVDNIVENGGYRFMRPSKFMAPITRVWELL